MTSSRRSKHTLYKSQPHNPRQSYVYRKSKPIIRINQKTSGPIWLNLFIESCFVVPFNLVKMSLLQKLLLNEIQVHSFEIFLID